VSRLGLGNHVTRTKNGHRPLLTFPEHFGRRPACALRKTAGRWFAAPSPPGLNRDMIMSTTSARTFVGQAIAVCRKRLPARSPAQTMLPAGLPACGPQCELDFVTLIPRECSTRPAGTVGLCRAEAFGAGSFPGGRVGMTPRRRPRVPDPADPSNRNARTTPIHDARSRARLVRLLLVAGGRSL